MKFWKAFLKGLAILFAGLILLLSVGSLVLYLRQDQLKTLFIGELNKNLVSPVSTKSIDFSLWKSFPNVEISFRDLKAKGKESSLPVQLMECGRLSLYFNILDIYYKRYKITRVSIVDGKFDLVEEEETNNYIIWKASKKQDPNFSFSLQKIVLKNTQVRYRNLPYLYDFNLFFTKAYAKGDFSNSGQTVSVKGNYFAHHLRFNGMELFKGRKGSLFVEFDNQSDTETIEIKKGQLHIENLAFDSKASICYGKGKQNVLVNFWGNQLSLSNLLEVVPSEYAHFYENYTGEGQLNFHMEIRSAYPYLNKPLVRAAFNYTQGKIEHKPSKTKIQDITIKGKYNNGKNRTLAESHIIIPEFSARIDQGFCKGSLSIENFKTPFIKLQTQASLKIDDIRKIMGDQAKILASGDIFLDLQYSHQLSSFDSTVFNQDLFLKSQYQGSLRLDNLDLLVQESGLSWSAEKLLLHFTPDELKIPPSDILLNRQKIKLSARVHNLLPYILKSEGILDGKINLQSPSLDLNTFISKKTESKQTDTSSFLALLLSPRLSCDISLQAGKLNYENLHFSDLQTMIRLKDQEIFVEECDLKAFDGKLSLKANIDLKNPKRIPIQSVTYLKEVDIQKLAIGLNNYNEKISPESFEGKINSTLNFSFTYLPDSGKIDLSSLLLWSHIKISSGQISNMENLKKLSKFTGEKELNTIRFSDFENTIEIKNSCLYIPNMYIANSALNLALSGTHQFNGNINYLLTVNLSEILSHRRKKRVKDEEFGVLVENNPKGIQLPIRISGTVENPQFVYDFKAARKNLKAKQIEEKENIKNILQQEFSQRENAKNNKETHKQWTEQEKGKFIINWEENEKASEKTEAPLSSGKPKSSENKTNEKAKFVIEFED